MVSTDYTMQSLFRYCRIPITEVSELCGISVSKEELKEVLLGETDSICQFSRYKMIMIVAETIKPDSVEMFYQKATKAFLRDSDNLGLVINIRFADLLPIIEKMLKVCGINEYLEVKFDEALIPIVPFSLAYAKATVN